tara:strand:- start:4116 stop:5054 length:939 start_codon:yes stop_codon:yes gene_type:complete
MFTREVKETVLKRFPNIELSYDKLIHNKVYADLFMIIPKGPKAFLWFTYVENKNVAILLLLNKQGNVKSLDIYPVCFEDDLSLGTLMYGTFFDINSHHHFSCEDIFTYKGRYVNNNRLNEKLKIYERLFECEILQKSYNKNFIIVGMPLWTSSYMNAINTIPTLPYRVYAIKSYNMRDNNGRSIGINLYKEKVKLEAIFKVKASIESDVYNLYCSDNQLYNVAAISSYKQSIMLNSIFRKIKENINLDYIEASDDEEDFENVDEDKYVDLNKWVLMKCIYNKHFKKWEPIEKVNNNQTIVNKREALLLEKNK